MDHGVRAQDLLIGRVQVLYAAELVCMRTFARAESAADSEDLRRSSDEQSRQSVLHRERLTEVFDQLGRPALMGRAPLIEAASTRCIEASIQGPMSPGRDAAIITAMRVLLRMLAAGYCSAELWADRSARSAAAALLHESLARVTRSEQHLSMRAGRPIPDPACSRRRWSGAADPPGTLRFTGQTSLEKGMHMQAATQATRGQPGQAPRRDHHAGRHHEPSHAEIQRRAYELYCERNGDHGSDVLDWLGAEQELRAAARDRAFGREENL